MTAPGGGASDVCPSVCPFFAKAMAETDALLRGAVLVKSDQITRRRSTAKLVQRLSNLGYKVTLVPKAA